MQLSLLLQELEYKAVKSSGPGGQHVNKTASKVEVYFNVMASAALSIEEKNLLIKRLDNRISEKGTLTLQCSESRSQHRNKKRAVERLIALLEQNLKVAKPRKKSKPSKGAIEKRLQSKKRVALKKSNRKKPPLS